MIVRLIAHTTTVNVGAWEEAGYILGEQRIADADDLAEFAGRLCYQSWDRPNPKTAANNDYLGNIINQAHFSVLEHASATFYVAGVSRSLSHELVRHRHLSFSQVSQRYVDESRAAPITPLGIGERLDHQDSTAYNALHDVFDRALDAYQQIVTNLTAAGLTRKQARQAARSVLPNATETKLVVTGNMRAWRDVITKRNSPHADAEIQELAKELLRQLKVIAPGTFQDL
jgi:thymidylate synthase (FAD)